MVYSLLIFICSIFFISKSKISIILLLLISQIVCQINWQYIPEWNLLNISCIPQTQTSFYDPQVETTIIKRPYNTIESENVGEIHVPQDETTTIERPSNTTESENVGAFFGRKKSNSEFFMLVNKRKCVYS